MICERCNCKEECEWYKSYKKIEMEARWGIGYDTLLGMALLETLENYNYERCYDFEEK